MKNKIYYTLILNFNLFSLFHFNTNYTFLENKFFYSTLFFSFTTFYLFYKLNNFNIDYTNLDFTKLDYLKLIEFVTDKKIDIIINQKIFFLKSIHNLGYNLSVYKDLVNNIVFDYYKDKDPEFILKLQAAKLDEKVIDFFKTYTNNYVKLLQPENPILFSSRMKPYNFSSDKITKSIDFLQSYKQGLTLNTDPEFFLQTTQHLLT